MERYFLRYISNSPYLNVVRRRIEAFKKEDGNETCYGQFKMEKL